MRFQLGFSGQFRTAIPIIVLFIILNITISMFFSMLFRVDRLQQTTRGLYSSDALFLALPGDAESVGEKYMDLVQVPDHSDYSVVNAIGSIRGIYYQGTVEKPPILKGRFFTEEKTQSNKPLALVGNNRWAEVEYVDTEPVIWLFDMEFTVIGQMGTSGADARNELILVNAGAVPVVDRVTGRIFIDGNEPEAILVNIQENARNLSMEEPVPVAQPFNLIEGVRQPMQIGWTYLITLTAILVTSSIILLSEWIRGRLHTIAVYRMVGYSPLRIAARYITQYHVLAITGTLLSIGIIQILYSIKYFKMHTTFLRQTLVVSGSSLVLGLLILLPTLLFTLRIDVVRVLRR